MRSGRHSDRELSSGVPIATWYAAAAQSASELRERQRLLLVVHHRDDTLSGLGVLADADVGDRVAPLERQERLVLALILLGGLAPAALLHAVLVEIEELRRVTVGREDDALGFVRQVLYAQDLRPVGDRYSGRKAVRHVRLAQRRRGRQGRRRFGGGRCDLLGDLFGRFAGGHDRTEAARALRDLGRRRRLLRTVAGS